MKTARIVLLVTLTVVLIAVLVLGAVAYYMVQRPLPRQKGQLAVPGMLDGITVYRDAWGVPHIYVANPYDLFFAQGFIHAQDRWWQMDVNRRFARGRLSELLGENEAVQAVDRMSRTLGWEHIARANWDLAPFETRAVLAAYAAGVNAYIANRDPGDLALEYTLLNLRMDDFAIEPWTPLDSLAWAVAYHWQTSSSAARDIENAQALTLVDETMLTLYQPSTVPGAAPTILQAGDMDLPDEGIPAAEGISLPAGADYTRLPLDDALAAFDRVGPRELPDDAAWVVGGSLTASGKPLLAVAPGMAVQMPSPWYEIGLYCIETSPICPYNVTGISLPGLPAVLSGHNASIAWGITSAWIDEQDIYIVRLNPDNPMQYAWNDGWRTMDVTQESLPVKGLDEPLSFTIYKTHLGPVIASPSRLVGRDQALVVHWTGQYSPYDPLTALLKLNRASDWTEFREALRRWGGAVVNVVYADVSGHIGYQMAGRVPIRVNGHSGLLPIPGQDKFYSWRGFVPYDLLPTVFNPARDVIVVANNPAVPEGYNTWLRDGLLDTFGLNASYTLGTTWDPGYRAARILVRLMDRDAHTAETFADIQGDTYSQFAVDASAYLMALSFEAGTLAEMQAWLGEWDHQFTMDSPQAALFGAFWQRLVEFTYADELGALLCDCASTRQGMLTLLAYANDPWWDNVQTRSVVERRDAILRQAFEQAVTDLTHQLGEDRDEWRWGDLHTATFTNLPATRLGVSLIESQFDRGPVGVSGSADTIVATRSTARPDARFQVASAPSARLIIDLNNFESSRAIHTTGQSNHLASAHYDDMIDPWRFIEYHTMLWERTSIEEAAADAILALEPVLKETPETE